MRLAKIKNKYMFKSNKPNGFHHYAVYYDRKNKRHNAVQLTHLYVKDDARFKQVKKGNILVEKFKEFETPTGVRNQYYNKNITDNKRAYASGFVSGMTDVYIDNNESAFQSEYKRNKKRYDLGTKIHWRGLFAGIKSNPYKLYNEKKISYNEAKKVDNKFGNHIFW